MKCILIFLIITVAFTNVAKSQKSPGFDECPDGFKSCGPLSKLNDRNQIFDSNLNIPPFNFILHQQIKRFSTNYSTGSFIAPGLIITAHHNVSAASFIRKLSFCNKAVDPEKWITFKKKEVEIFYFGAVDAPTDIAIIKLNNPEKVKLLYKGHFSVDSIGSADDTSLLHLSGFPCDIPDVLVDKSILKTDLQLPAQYALIGYNIYTCTGDSGAPAWIVKNGVPTIVGIHHGGGEWYLPKDWNCSAKITNDVLEWIAALSK